MSTARRETLAVAALLAALVAWSFAQRRELLTATPGPIGVDGYFYPIELRGLLAHGALPDPASPATFWLFAPLAALTDPVTGAKLGAAIGGAAIAIPAYGIGRRLGGGRGAGLVAAAIATTSAGSRYLTIEFVKNGVGLTAALVGLWLVLWACEQPTRARLATAAVGVALAALVHKMALVLVVVLGAPAVIAELRQRAAVTRRTWLALGAVAGAAVIAVVVLGVVAPQRFVSAADVALVGKLVVTHATWSAPMLDVPHLTLTGGYEALLGGLVALVALAGLVERRLPAWLSARRYRDRACRDFRRPRAPRPTRSSRSRG